MRGLSPPAVVAPLFFQARIGERRPDRRGAKGATNNRATSYDPFFCYDGRERRVVQGLLAWLPAPGWNLCLECDGAARRAVPRYAPRP